MLNVCKCLQREPTDLELACICLINLPCRPMPTPLSTAKRLSAPWIGAKQQLEWRQWGVGDVGEADPDETSQDVHRPCKVWHRVGGNTSVISAHALSDTGIVLTSVPSE